MNSNRDERASEGPVPSEIAAFCGDCHALPKPGSFAREVWYDEIKKGYEFYARSGRSDLRPPPLQSVLNYYRQHAPERLELPEPPPVDEAWRSRFRKQEFDWNDGKFITPAVSALKWTRFLPEDVFRLVATDMRDGSINLINPSPERLTRRMIGRVGNPARVAPCDLNHDGRTDLVVADLGSFHPYDHAFGSVRWLQRDPTSIEFQAHVLVGQLGRVADLAVADFAGDTRPDLILAEFGHRRTGSIRLLTNVSPKSGLPAFDERLIDHRPGTVQISVHDWDRDGQQDFAAVISQEFECVELFVNRIRKFDRLRIAEGDDLTFGSVGLELTDLDLDGDQDLLYVNGDCFDNNFANRSHGLQWLENLGGLEFRYHRLADLPGAYRAVPADLDQDGDLDIVAVANLPSLVYPISLSRQNPASIVLLEQVAPLNFALRVLERGTPRYPALEVADFNGDGLMDFVVGTQLFDTDPPGSPAANLPRIQFWWQEPAEAVK